MALLDGTLSATPFVRIGTDGTTQLSFGRVQAHHQEQQGNCTQYNDTHSRSFFIGASYSRSDYSDASPYAEAFSYRHQRTVCTYWSREPNTSLTRVMGEQGLCSFSRGLPSSSFLSRAIYEQGACRSVSFLRGCLKSQTNRLLERAVQMYFERFSNRL